MLCLVTFGANMSITLHHHSSNCLIHLFIYLPMLIQHISNTYTFDNTFRMSKYSAELRGSLSTFLERIQRRFIDNGEEYHKIVDVFFEEIEKVSDCIEI